MRVVLEPGEKVTIVTYTDGDGEVEVSFEDIGTVVRVDGKEIHHDPFEVDDEGEYRGG